MSASKNFLILLGLILAGIIMAVVSTIIVGDRSNAYKSNNDLIIEDLVATSQKIGDMIVGVEEDDSKMQASTSSVITVDGVVYMLVSEFLSLTGDEIDNENNFVHNEFKVPANDYLKDMDGVQYINFYNLLQDLGWTCILEDSYILSRTFSTKRLIVETEKNLVADYNAIGKVKSLDSVYLQYATEYEAMIAYNALKFYYNVAIDYKIVSQSDEDYSFLVNDSPNYSALNVSSGSHFNSWGGDMMGFYEYNNYLKSTCDTLNDVEVVVIDTGINAHHPLFNGRISSYAISFAVGNKTYFYNDEDGHGTHVAGTIAELTTSNVKILPIKVQGDNDYFYSSSLHLSYKYILSLKNKGVPIRVVNGSYGVAIGENVVAGIVSDFRDGGIRRIVDNGIVFCAAAGNENSNVKYQSPANVDGVVAVAAFDKYITVCSFSNWGDGVMFSAPGENIYSADYASNGIVRLSGTSMACPHIASTFAMLASDSLNNYDAEKMKEVLIDCAVDIGENGKDIHYGYGYINLRKLIPNNQAIAKTKQCLLHTAVICDTLVGKPYIEISYVNEYFVAQTLYSCDWNDTPIIVNAINGIECKKNVGYYEYELLGWYVGMYNGGGISGCDTSSFFSTSEEISLSDFEEGEEIYVLAKCKIKTVKVIITMNFIDSPDYNGYFGYGVNLKIKASSYNVMVGDEVVEIHGDYYIFNSTPRIHTFEIDKVRYSGLSLYCNVNDERDNYVSSISLNGRDAIFKNNNDEIFVSAYIDGSYVINDIFSIVINVLY